MKTLVIGDMNVDIIVRGASGLPVLGHEITCKAIRTVMGGSASIFSSRLGQLGGKVSIFGKLGNDQNGKVVLRTLRSSHVSVSKVKILDTIQTGATISLSYPRNKALVTCTDGIDTITASDIAPELFRGYGHLHISSIYLLRGLLSSLPTIFGEAKEQGLTTSLDTNADPLGKYEYIDEILDNVDIFLPNEKEARHITKSENVTSALRILSAKVPVVVIKCGERGAAGRRKDDVVWEKPIRIESIDTTGAGDSFDAGFVYYFLHKKRPFDVSVRFATALGTLSCLYIGGAERKIDESDVLTFMNRGKTPGGQDELS